MGDEDGPFVAGEIYQSIFNGEKDYIDPACIPYALDRAVKKLREVDTSPSRWAQYIHLGV